MSTTRILIRVLLVLVLAAMSFLIWRTWQRNQPDYYWNRALAAAARDDAAAARIFLQNLLREHPQHAQGHKLLAEVYLDEAKAQDPQADYRNQPEAFGHLVEAARHDRDNVDLQKQIVEVYYDTGRMLDAAAVAPHVLKTEKNHARALFASAVRAIDTKNYAAAGQFLAQLKELPDRPLFRTAAAEVQLGSSANDAEKIQQGLDSAVALAAAASAEQMAALAPEERAAMLQLLQLAVLEAPDAATAEKRSRDALTALETLAKVGETPQQASPYLGDAADTATRIALGLDERHPLPETPSLGGPDAASPTGLAMRRQIRHELNDRVEQLRVAALVADQASLLSYHQSARTAFDRGDEARGLELIKQGLAAAEKLPEAQREQALDLHLLAARRLVATRRFKQAEDHIAPLMQNSRSAGWGHLLSGSVRSAEGKHEQALEQFLKAERTLGSTMLVRMALANTRLALSQWREALPYLESLHQDFSRMDREQAAWAAQHLGSESNVYWGELRAYLSLGQWKEAQKPLESLKGTPLEPRAWTAAIAWLWQNNRREDAEKLLASVRDKFPADMELVRLNVAMLNQTNRADEAEKLLEKLAQGAPSDVPRQAILCRWYMAKGQLDKAREQLDQMALRLEPTPANRVVQAVLKAQLLLLEDKPEEAMAAVEPLADDPQSAAIANLVRVGVELKEKDWQGASQALAALSGNTSAGGTLGLLQGELSAAQGDYDLAVDQLSASMQVTAVRERARNAFLRSVLLMAQQKGPAEAAAKVDALLKQYPDDPALVMVRADLEFQQGRLDAGMQLLSRVEQLEPKRPDGPYLKGVAWLKVGRANEALAEARRALKLAPDNVPALVLAAQAALALGENAPAVDYAAAAVKHNPQQWDAHLLEIEALARLGRHADALPLAESLVEKQPQMLAGHLAAASLLGSLNRRDDATAAFVKAREQIPGDLALLTAEVTHLAGFDAAAASHLAESQAGDKPNTLTCLAIAQGFQAAKRMDEAETWAKRGLAAAEDDQRVLANLFLGNLALSIGMPTKDTARLASARDYFQAVLEVEPRNMLAANNLAWLLADCFDDPQRAVTIIELARGDIPVDQFAPSVLDTMAMVYRTAGRLDEAVELLKPALQRYPDEPLLNFQLGMALAAQKRTFEAQQALERALRLGLSGEARDQAQRELDALRTAAAGPQDTAVPPAKP